MRCHVHGKLEHAGGDVAFTISLDALTRESAELYVLDLFKGPYAVPAIDARIRDTDGPPDVEITDVDIDEPPGGPIITNTEEINRRVLDDLARSSRSQILKKGRNQTRNALAVHRRRHQKPFRMKYLRDAW